MFVHFEFYNCFISDFRGAKVGKIFHIQNILSNIFFSTIVTFSTKQCNKKALTKSKKLSKSLCLYFI